MSDGQYKSLHDMQQELLELYQYDLFKKFEILIMEEAELRAFYNEKIILRKGYGQYE